MICLSELTLYLHLMTDLVELNWKFHLSHTWKLANKICARTVRDKYEKTRVDQIEEMILIKGGEIIYTSSHMLPEDLDSCSGDTDGKLPKW